MLSFVPVFIIVLLFYHNFLFINPFSSKIASIISNSPYTLSYNSYAVSLENLVLDIIFTLITCLLDIVLLL